MRVILTRDSVCMGDDCWAPHEMVQNWDEATTVGEFTRWFSASGYCRQSNWWVMSTGWNRPGPVPLALLAAPWDQPTFLDDADQERALGSLAEEDGAVRLFFAYCAGQPARANWPELKRLKEKAAPRRAAARALAPKAARPRPDVASASSLIRRILGSAGN
ncbi:hypothetical protein [Kitasatospora sp. NPDC093558]|uniref:hypothetical protein n=1 Tax=Kitasatospora sp. NPDC093558 TaxID=3155201 RepID=UPI00343826B0